MKKILTVLCVLLLAGGLSAQVTEQAFSSSVSSVSIDADLEDTTSFDLVDSLIYVIDDSGLVLISVTGQYESYGAGALALGIGSNADTVTMVDIDWAKLFELPMTLRGGKWRLPFSYSYVDDVDTDGGKTDTVYINAAVYGGESSTLYNVTTKAVAIDDVGQ